MLNENTRQKITLKSFLKIKDRYLVLFIMYSICLSHFMFKSNIVPQNL